MNASIPQGVALASLLLITACGGPVPMPPGMRAQEVTAEQFAPVPFRCPDPPVMVSHWNSEPVRYAGRHATDPETCQTRSMGSGPEGGMARHLFMVFGDAHPPPGQLPLPGEANIRAAMRTFWPLRPQHRATFTYLGAHSPDTASPLISEAWHVLGPRSVRLESVGDGPAAIRSAVAVERVVQSLTLTGVGQQTRWTYWFDRETGALLRTNAEMFRGMTASLPVAARQPAAAMLQTE